MQVEKNMNNQMDKTVLDLLTKINVAVLQYRSVYVEWTKKNKMTYTEMLVLYSLRDGLAYTQKEICEQYQMPKQTVNNVITALRQSGYLCFQQDQKNRKEKKMELTKEGEKYCESALASLTQIENNTIKIMGEGRANELADRINEYTEMLRNELKEIEG